MGIYLNPGKAAFEEAINSEIYVDKTEMLAFLNHIARTKQKYVCVSRPRRFGKTMAADMLCAYYDREADSRSLFEKWKNSRWREGQGHGILFPFPSPVLFLPCVSKQCVHWFPIQDFNLNNVGQSISCWNLLDFHASYVSEIESCLNKHAWVIRFNHCIVFH